MTPELAGCVGDTAIALSVLADGRDFLEVKAAWAREMVTGFIKLNGATVGCVANRCEVYEISPFCKGLIFRMGPR